MATKKYVSLEKLSLYDEKIKKVISDGDAAALASAKSYADGLAVNYEAAGAVATAKTELQGKIDVAQAAADTAQGEVDALELLVGTLPDGTTATSVVEYVNVKTAGIATDAALAELQGQVTAAQDAIDVIEADYLKAADKSELNDLITAEADTARAAEEANAAAIKVISDDYLKAADKTELQGSIGDVQDAVDAIEADYLTSADKTELQGKIDLKAAQTALDAEVERATGVEANLQAQINTIMNNPDAEGAINSINEFTQYVADHGTIADGFRADIDQNKADIAAMDTAYKAADTAMSARVDALEAIDHDAYVAADAALKNELTTEIGKKADASVVSDMDAAYKAADEALSGRLDDVEAALGTGEGSVSDQIADAKQEAIDAAAADATSKASAAESAAKTYADGLNTVMDGRMGAVEAKAHEHSNKAELDLIVSGDKAKWDAAAAKAHEHSNLSVLEGITAAKITAWDAAEGNAKTYADGLNTAMDSRVTTLETWHNNFIEVSEEEINALFA